MRCRIFPHEVRDGPANMAWDEALLDSVADDPSAAVFRTYEWSRPTLSLGYFQAIAEAEADPRWRSSPIVRRPTGGGAIWHDGDLTYALILPADHPLARRAVDLYAVVHSAIRTTLAELGIMATRRGENTDPTRSRPFLCFLDRDPEDLVLDGSKIVGSAQRRRRGAVLQHGSILRKSSPVTPELPGLDRVGVGPIGDWLERVREPLAASLGLEPIRDGATLKEHERASDLTVSVYDSDSWTRRR